MKKVYAILWIILLPAGLFAQQFSDANTEVINSYFQSSSTNISTQTGQADALTQNPGIKIVQNGDFNETYIQSVQAGDRQTVIQKGNNNSYEFYNYANRENTQMIINQEGQFNSLQIYGENSLMKNAVINQKSNYKTLIIKNYNN